MSVPSENIPVTATMHSTPLVLRHLPYFLAAAVAVFAAATMSFDGYILNILMQATTFAIAVFGLSVVLGLCGQINLAQAAFFGLGAYAVGLGTADYQINFWICLVAGSLLALAAISFTFESSFPGAISLNTPVAEMISLGYLYLVSVLLFEVVLSVVVAQPDGRWREEAEALRGHLRWALPAMMLIVCLVAALRALPG